jgi:hypothetical protein
MGPTSGAFQQRVKRRPILRVQFREFSTKLIETFDLIFEGRQTPRPAARKRSGNFGDGRFRAWSFWAPPPKTGRCWRKAQRVRQTPDIDFQPLQPLGKSVGISD